LVKGGQFFSAPEQYLFADVITVLEKVPMVLDRTLVFFFLEEVRFL